MVVRRRRVSDCQSGRPTVGRIVSRRIASASATEFLASTLALYSSRILMVSALLCCAAKWRAVAPVACEWCSRPVRRVSAGIRSRAAQRGLSTRALNPAEAQLSRLLCWLRVLVLGIRTFNLVFASAFWSRRNLTIFVCPSLDAESSATRRCSKKSCSDTKQN